MTDLVAIDFETSGLTPGLHGPRSLAAVADGVRPFVVHFLPRPHWLADPVADKKNGYTPERWEELGAVPFDQGMGWFLDWWREANTVHGRLLPLAHNAGFDKAWMEWCLKSGPWIGIEIGPRWRCSMAGLGLLMDAGVVPEGSASLDRLCDLAGITGRAKKHEALWDARACLAGYRWLLELLQGRASA